MNYTLNSMQVDVGIVIVNWNAWADTLECLEAVFRLHEFCGPVVVCDNGSVDGSLDAIELWAMSALCIIPEGPAKQVRDLVIPPVGKSIDFRRVTRCQSQEAGDAISQGVRLILVDCGANLGFAGANNAGLRMLGLCPTIKYFWLLNNDALPARDSLRELKSVASRQDGPVITGSVLLEYWRPDTIQALGGRYWLYWGRCKPLMKGEPEKILSQMNDAVPVDYPVGAALMVNREFIETYGLMCEDYFLYFEEVDWVIRMGWPSRAFIATRSLVYHKGGKSTLGGQSGRDRSLMADYYIIRGRMLLARKISFLARFTVFAATTVAVMGRIFRPQKGVVNNAIRALQSGLLDKKTKENRL